MYWCAISLSEVRFRINIFAVSENSGLHSHSPALRADK